MLRKTVLCLCLVIAGFYGKAIDALTSYKIFYRYITNESGEQAIQPYIEIYWQINPTTIPFKKNEKGHWQAQIKTDISITQKDNFSGETYNLKSIPAVSKELAILQNISDLQRYELRFGKVNIELSLTDESGSSYLFSDSIIISKPEKEIFYSNLQLIDTSYKSDISNNVYSRNGFLQIPLSADFIDDHRQFLHYYFELYGMDKLSEEQQPVVQTVYISKKEDNMAVYELIEKDTLTINTPISSLRGYFPIAVLPSGNYYLNTTLADVNGNVLDKNSVFFQRSNLHPVKPEKDADTSEELTFEKVSVFDLSQTFVEEYTAAQLKAIIKMLLPIATPVEKTNIEAFSKRSEELYLRYFIYNFWKSRSPVQPDKAWKDYTKKVKEVNKLFGSGRTPGYETERGFMYLKYGKPDQRFTVSNEEGAWPYEVWQYNIAGETNTYGAFLFYNPGFMMNDYQLLHSTVIGEVRNSNWRSQLYKSSTASGNLNSRAQQVFQGR